jgi:hypothetical protein
VFSILLYLADALLIQGRQEELRTVRTQGARLIDAVKHGQELQALVTALHRIGDER